MAAMKRKWIWISCFILVLLAYVVGRASAPQDRVKILSFYSEESGGIAAREALIDLFQLSIPLRFNPIPLTN